MEDTSEEYSEREESYGIDKINHRYPYCVVWVPIPCLTFLFPFIGHVGLCDSKGIIYDFSGPYSITVDRLLFGNPIRYYSFEKKLTHEMKNKWDITLNNINEKYRGKMHNLVFQNCHHHVVDVIKLIFIEEKWKWNMFYLMFLIFFSGKYVNGFSSVICHIGPCVFCAGISMIIIAVIITVIVLLTRS